jgi:hypothetical protein
MAGKPGMSREHKLARKLGFEYESSSQRKEREEGTRRPRGRRLSTLKDFEDAPVEDAPQAREKPLPSVEEPSKPFSETVKEPGFKEDFDLIKEVDEQSTDFEEPPAENSLVELRNLINKKDIDVKTILSSDQILVIHKIDTIERVFREYGADLPDEERREALKCASLCKLYTNRFFELSINNGGISRKQYLEGVHKSEERETNGNKVSLDSPVVRVG